MSSAPKFQSYLNKPSLDFFNSVCEGLGRLNVNFEIDQSLVRGLDYYSHTAFEFMTNYVERFKNKIKIKKLDSNQPIGAWIFVIVLNIIGFAGYFYLKINHIQLGG